MAFVPFWFILITILWTGFFILEGFDLGVGMLHGIVGRDDAGRRAVMNTIGPLWDGNEVWLIVAAAAIFAAFPLWYATMLSGFYLPLVILLVALMMRGVSFEYRGKSPGERWRGNWSRALTIASFFVPLLIGIVLGDLLHGLPINASHEYTGSFWDLLQPYGILTGVTLVGICVLHGATFIAMKTDGEVRDRAQRTARLAAPFVALLVIAFIAWTHVLATGGAFLNPVELIACMAVIAAALQAAGRHEGWAFTATTVTIAICIITIFTRLYPRVMVSSTNPAYSLTAHNAASPPYTLKVMTVVALVLLPFVLAYQAWTYYVFRRRVTMNHAAPPAASPAPQPVAATAPAGPTPAPPQRRPRHLPRLRRLDRGLTRQVQAGARADRCATQHGGARISGGEILPGYGEPRVQWIS
jgi:cytochrome bd ubiquinol oxidase subunit II